MMSDKVDSCWGQREVVRFWLYFQGKDKKGFASGLYLGYEKKENQA